MEHHADVFLNRLQRFEELPPGTLVVGPHVSDQPVQFLPDHQCPLSQFGQRLGSAPQPLNRNPPQLPFTD